MSSIEAIECINWYTRTAQLIEPRLEPLNLTDKEILDWLDEYADGVTQTSATRTTNRAFTIISDVVPVTKGKTLREAVCRAAARLKEFDDE